MLINTPTIDHWQKSGLLRARIDDISAGAICSVLSIAYSLSYAALIFSGPLSQWLGYGMTVMLLSASVASLVIGLRSSLPFAIAGPDSGTSVVMAALAAFVTVFVNDIVTQGGTENLLQCAIIAIALSTTLTAVALLVLGLTRGGRAIRFVPYPVIAGFLGATGWLLVVGGTQLTIGQSVSGDTADIFSLLTDPKLLASGTLATALFFGQRWLRSSFVVPGLLLAGVLAVHLGLRAFGVPLDEAQANGWMFGSQSQVAFTSPWHIEDLRRFPWQVVLPLFGHLVSLIFVATITVLLNTSAIEINTERESDLDHELKWHGIANLFIAAFAGYVSTTSVSRTTANFLAGATGRLSAIIVAAATLIAAVDQGILGYVPKCVLGGLLLFIGADLLYRWLLESSRRLAYLEYVSLLAVAFIIIQWGFVAGLLIGIVVGCATFALSSSRIPAIKFSFDGSEYHSSLDRGPEELAVLSDYGHELQGMSLQGYLFFGTASRLHEHTKALLAGQPRCRFLVFDYRFVTGIDSSATHCFRQIKQLADRRRARLVFVNMTTEIKSAFRLVGLISEHVVVATDLDHALEQCEDTIIKAHQPVGTEAESLREWLVHVVGAEHAFHLVRACQRLMIGPGEIVASKGDPADSMHFIFQGRVGIIVDVGNGRKARVRSLGQRTTIGEMGLITGQVRSATIEAEVPSVLYVLKADAFEQIRKTNPALCQALLTYVIRVMSERLNFANRSIAALLR